MVINTQRLRLRPFTLDDEHSTSAYACDAENTKYMLFLPHQTRGDLLRFLREAVAEWQKPRPAFYEFAVERRGEHIGAISLYLNEARTEAELGWIIHRDHWGRGYVTEAAAAIVAFAARTLGLSGLVAHCDSRNAGSVRAMEKVGFTLAGDSGVRCDKCTGLPVRELEYRLPLERAKQPERGPGAMAPHTPRLRLVPLTPPQLELWLCDLPALEAELDCIYRGTPVLGVFAAVVRGQLDAARRDETHDLFHTFWWMVRGEDRVAVGSLVWKGPPDGAGQVELGYGIAPEFEGRGYTTEAVGALCAWAAGQPGIRAVIAETDPGGAASCRVLEKNGFRRWKDGGENWWRREL